MNEDEEILLNFNAQSTVAAAHRAIANILARTGAMTDKEKDETSQALRNVIIAQRHLDEAVKSLNKRKEKA